MLGFESSPLNIPRIVQDAKHGNANRGDCVIQNVRGGSRPTANTFRQFRPRPTHQGLYRKDVGFAFDCIEHMVRGILVFFRDEEPRLQ